MLQAVALELGYDCRIFIESDASAALSAAEEEGILKFKHLAIKWLFLQELIERKTVRVEDGYLDEQARRLLDEARQREHP